MALVPCERQSAIGRGWHEENGERHVTRRARISRTQRESHYDRPTLARGKRRKMTRRKPRKTSGATVADSPGSVREAKRDRPTLARRKQRKAWNARGANVPCSARNRNDPAAFAGRSTRRRGGAWTRMCVRVVACEQHRWHPSSAPEKREAAASRADTNLRSAPGPTNNK